MCNNNLYKYIILVLSAITGIAFGVIFSLGILTNVLAVIPYFAVISAVILAILIILLLLPINRKKALSKCLCQYGGIIAVTSILTIALVLVILSVTLAATSTLSAVLIGLLFALISAVFLSFLFFIYCIINKKCGCNNSYNNNYCCYSASNTSNVDSCGFDLE